MEALLISQEFLSSSFGYLIIFLLMLSNGVFSFPSSQIIYIVSGVLIGKGVLSIWPVVLLGGAGNAIGNMIIYKLSYTYGEPLIEKFFMIHHAQIKAFQAKVQKHGTWLLFVGKITPSIKVVTPFVAGLAKIKSSIALLIFITTSVLWSYAFVTLGKVFGTKFSMSEYTLIMGIFGVLIAFYFYKNYIKPLQEK
jgi:membrane protein DedA with SNARE-associated domain